MRCFEGEKINGVLSVCSIKTANKGAEKYEASFVFVVGKIFVGDSFELVVEVTESSCTLRIVSVSQN